MTSAPLRIGVLGAANIARQFISAVKPSATVTVTAVASRDQSKARAFANENGVEQAYGSYEALLDDPAVEAVYLPLPNSLHAEWAIKAAQAGKHVLSEKPISVTGAEAKAMVAAARANGVHLVEGYPYMAQPQTMRMRELLREGAVGKVQLIQASFGFSLLNPDTNIRMVADLGGGARLDAGSYPISLVRVVAGVRPSRVLAAATWFKEGVDRTLIASLEFPNGVLAQVGCSFATANHRHAFIGGDEGAIMTTFLNHAPPGETLELQVKRTKVSNAPFETLTVPGTNGFLAEAESFAALVREQADGWTGVTPEESIDIMLTIDAITESLRSGTWATVAA
jgi:predicted dehydrogenase